MNNIKPLIQCPSCHRLVGVHSNPHCRSETCTWNACTCGQTFDRFTGSHFQTHAAQS